MRGTLVDLPRSEVVKVVDDLIFASRSIGEMSGSVRRITLSLNALVPIVKWGGAGLLVNDSSPRILARRLIEVAVDD